MNNSFKLIILSFLILMTPLNLKSINWNDLMFRGFCGIIFATTIKEVEKVIDKIKDGNPDYPLINRYSELFGAGLIFLSFGEGMVNGTNGKLAQIFSYIKNALPTISLPKISKYRILGLMLPFVLYKVWQKTLKEKADKNLSESQKMFVQATVFILSIALFIKAENYLMDLNLNEKVQETLKNKWKEYKKAKLAKKLAEKLVEKSATV